jgi:hypothetical protein
VTYRSSILRELGILPLLGNCDQLCFLPAGWKVLQLQCTVVDGYQMVDEVTWQFFNHTVGHSVMAWNLIRLRVLNDPSHFNARHWLNTRVKSDVAKALQPSSNQFVMIPGLVIDIISYELIFLGSPLQLWPCQLHRTSLRPFS